MLSCDERFVDPMRSQSVAPFSMVKGHTKVTPEKCRNPVRSVPKPTFLRPWRNCKAGGGSTVGKSGVRIDYENINRTFAVGKHYFVGAAAIVDGRFPTSFWSLVHQNDVSGSGRSGIQSVDSLNATLQQITSSAGQSANNGNRTSTLSGDAAGAFLGRLLATA